MPGNWSARKRNDIVQVDVGFQPKKDWDQWVLLRTDAHWDNVKSNRDLQKEHLDLAKQRNAIVLDGGDLFCAMQGVKDKRSSKSALREEHKVSNYFDSLVDTAAEWHMPYADQFAMLAHGNHETAIKTHGETDLTARLAEKLGCLAMPITGFVRFTFKYKTETYKYELSYHHGYGGGGPVTKDVIQSARKAVYISSDIVWSGHTHDAWAVPITKLDVTQDGHVKKRLQWHIKTSTYKDDYAKGASNWSNEKGHPPKPLGAMWIRFFYRPKTKRTEKCSRRISLEIIPAIETGND